MPETCAQCGKRVPLVYEVMCRCKCARVFCLAHRLPEQHECTYTWTFDASKLTRCVKSKMNPDLYDS